MACAASPTAPILAVTSAALCAVCCTLRVISAVAAPCSSTAEAIARARANGDGAVLVLDHRDRPVGWPWLRQLKGDTIVDSGQDLVNLDERATLNDALDTMLSSSHGAAVITGDRDRFVGVVDFDTVTEHVRATQAELQQAQEERDD